MFLSYHRPISHRFRVIGHFRLKSPVFPTPVYTKGFPLEFGIGVRGPKCLIDGLPGGLKRFKIGLVVLIQYRLWRTSTHPATQPARHVTIFSQLQPARVVRSSSTSHGDRARRDHYIKKVTFIFRSNTVFFLQGARKNWPKWPTRGFS